MKKLRKLLVWIICLGSLLSYGQVYKDPAYSVEERVEDLLSQMTLDEKIGQMTQVNWQAINSVQDIENYFIGSFLNGGGGAPYENTPQMWAFLYDTLQDHALNTRLGIPMIYGTDAVHGHNNLRNAVIFPHNIGMGCTRNYALIEEAAKITAIEVAATGVDWTFAPCIAVPRDERWGRTYEGYSEDPTLVAMCGEAAIKGFQGASLDDSTSILACAKHYAGDGGTIGGDDQGNVILSEEEFRAIHVAPYIEAVNAGVATVMASYNSLNGEKMHGSEYYLTSVLKEELGFDGFIVSDWAAIDQLPGDYESDIRISINAGIDMVMVPNDYAYFFTGLKNQVDAGNISMDRIDDANRRILTQKFRMGLFENPYSDPSLLDSIGTPGHRAVARQCVRESLVLLKNKNRILPISKDAAHIHVGGKSANNIGLQCGGWTISWQGSPGDITEGTTVYEAINKVASGEVSYALAGYNEAADGADVAVVVIGEYPYAEGNGDRTDLSLTREDISAVKSLYDQGIKVVTILISGRPMIIDDIWHYSDAVIAAWLPGTEGDGITDILFGDYEPVGKLSYTWPKSMDQIPINFGDADYDPLFPLGYGIDTFALPAPEDPPGVLSSATSVAGDFIELTFDKAMIVPENTLLHVDINDMSATIGKIEIKPDDSNTLLIYCQPQPEQTDRIIISSSGGIATEDGSQAESFTYDVYNAIQYFQRIPGKIEAEDFVSMSGIQLETCSDEGGGLNVGYIETGDYMNYLVEVTESGQYEIRYRVASLSIGGQITLQLSEGGSFTDLHTISFPATGGWQEWTTVQDLVDLEAGKYSLRLLADMNGFNINWFSFAVPDDIILTETTDQYPVQVYPNPVEGGSLNFSSTGNESIKFTIFSSTGSIFLKGSFISTTSIDISGLMPGLYLIRFEGENFMVHRKVIVK
jgi:beta-glucosidase